MIGIVDYGMGNIQSVRNAFVRLGSSVRIVTSGREIAECRGLVLPGVGAFHMAMQNLSQMGLIPSIQQVVAQGTPLLGICLGLQLLAESSEEHGQHEGLGLIPGRVRRIPVSPGHRLPHIGWNTVSLRPRTDDVLFAGIKNESAYYFVHSFMLDCEARYVTAVTDHGGPVTAAVQSGSIFAVQFHPEKSQTNGLRLLKNFVRQVAVTAEEHA